VIRKIAAVCAVLAVVLLGPVPAASAVQATATVAPAVGPDIENLGGMSLWQKMVTITGSLLGSDSGKGTTRVAFYSAANTGFSENKRLRR